MRNFLRKAIPFLVIGLFVLMVAILPELYGGIVVEWCERKLGVNWPIIVLVFSVLILGLAVKYKPSILGDLLPNSKDKDNPNSKPEDITHFYPKIRENLKTRYKSRLKQKLANRHPVNLRRLPSFYGTSDETAITFVPYGPGEIQEEMAQTFREARGRLLLIGAPGAGKTSLLLQLVLDLLETEKEALPVIINLATWTKDYSDLQTWLREILPAELEVNKALANQILLDNRLILLFDGLDEVKEESRKSCLEAIGRYGMDGKRRFVITSRMEEYEMVEKDAPVNLQIEVGPLTIEQVEKSLAAMGHEQPEAMRLFYALQEDLLLREAVQTPFYLNCLQFLFSSGKIWSELKFEAKTLKGRNLEIIQQFVGDILKVSDEETNTIKNSWFWLKFWASRLDRKSLVVFELINLNFDWWNWKKNNLRISTFILSISMLFLLFILFFTSFCLLGLVLGIVLGNFSNGLYYGAIIGALLTLIAFCISTRALIKDFPSSLYKATFQDIEELKSVKKIKATKQLYLVSAMVKILPLCLLGSIIGLFFGEFLNGVKIGFVIAIYFSILEFIFINALNSLMIFKLKSPYQRFRIYFHLLPIHLHLRWLLYRKGLLPLRLVDFLNEMTERHILESDGAIFDKNGKIIKSGATWRFRHRILQEYFANQWVEPTEQ